jgi:hypothetical protein
MNKKLTVSAAETQAGKDTCTVNMDILPQQHTRPQYDKP